jgi:stress response protein YsnF
VNEQAGERREPWYDGDTLMVPVYEEVLVSSTQLMLRKVIRVRNRGAREQVNLRCTVRREILDIEQVDS